MLLFKWLKFLLLLLLLNNGKNYLVVLLFAGVKLLETFSDAERGSLVT